MCAHSSILSGCSPCSIPILGLGGHQMHRPHFFQTSVSDSPLIGGHPSDCSLFQEPPLQSRSVHLVCTGLCVIPGALAFFSALHHFLPSPPPCTGNTFPPAPIPAAQSPKGDLCLFPFPFSVPAGALLQYFHNAENQDGAGYNFMCFPFECVSVLFSHCLFKSSHSFFFNYIFNYFWLCWVFVAVWAFLWLWRAGSTLVVVHGLISVVLISVASLAVEHMRASVVAAPQL